MDKENAMRPLIGITSSMGLGIYSMTQENMPQLQHRMNETYVRAVTEAGGIPVILPNSADLSLVKELIDRLDGVLLSGGGDVDPALYGRRPNAQLGSVTPRRDAFELAVARYVLNETDKPLLGICRGIQVMNVAMGGTLYIDLPTEGKLSHSLSMYQRDQVSHILPSGSIHRHGSKQRCSFSQHTATGSLKFTPSSLLISTTKFPISSRVPPE